ncbi:hypothetical protein BFJ63_vAg15906 [Fusarium oxysporum f. sp. narcissi]|uniref:Uncharacterized protein n=2 Tax=Fusarium oxysporum TaxID=5507 RepID=A0A4Q2V3H7_FUSOX|nr:hypothetical protein BFJ65_g15990 [Fusarium oxysporum f. sp. cepae]RKK27465.1 hypothetical protein BFJ66_g16639 [Fusarium oxysporum f. sp. cepae]RYC81212.1 hypothetical protein BFJ63_vAg15906 [Fusarium oxysporum f. sp. narcissi]
MNLERFVGDDGSLVLITRYTCRTTSSPKDDDSAS